MTRRIGHGCRVAEFSIVLEVRRTAVPYFCLATMSSLEEFVMLDNTACPTAEMATAKASSSAAEIVWGRKVINEWPKFASTTEKHLKKRGVMSSFVARERARLSRGPQHASVLAESTRRGIAVSWPSLWSSLVRRREAVLRSTLCSTSCLWSRKVRSNRFRYPGHLAPTRAHWEHSGRNSLH